MIFITMLFVLVYVKPITELVYLGAVPMTIKCGSSYFLRVTVRSLFVLLFFMLP